MKYGTKKGRDLRTGEMGERGRGGDGGSTVFVSKQYVTRKLIKMTAMAIMCSPIHCLGMTYSLGILKVSVFTALESSLT